MLFLVPTPIGNLGDITFRALDILKSVDIILAEDTRVTGKLKKHFSIDTPMRSFHTHNEHQKITPFIEELKQGSRFALVSDAGTPCISDPGYLLVRACHENGITVSCLPGASALTAAIGMGGISSDRFHFEGFLPVKKGRHTRLEYLSKLTSSIVLYESPHRLIKTLTSLKEYLGADRKASVIKEISKIHETVFWGTIEEVVAQIESRGSVKGEYVILIDKE